MNAKDLEQETHAYAKTVRKIVEEINESELEHAESTLFETANHFGSHSGSISPSELTVNIDIDGLAHPESHEINERPKRAVCR